ncbi:YraN family protein [Paenibacillus sp. 1P07SE]|uniref:YraN family protein n=1 Tax=Paenibacillus sp. 1P07SE TaxID=3132209 RepID=UPI0039A440C3
MQNKRAAALSRVAVGKLGEAAARVHIESLAWRIRDLNWRCRSGELDIVAEPPEEGSPLVFIEVRSRREGSRFGTAAESVDARKQLQLRSTAQVYLYGKRLQERRVRFDVITVLMDRDCQVIDIRHYEEAF